jgi:hypothetical protein
MVKWDQPRLLPMSIHLTIFYLFPWLFAAIPRSIPAEKRPEKAMGGAGVKKEGKGSPLFHAGRTPDRGIRSLFGFRIVKFGIAA